MLSLPNIAFAAVVIAAAVTPIVNPTPKATPEQERLIAAVKTAGGWVTPIEGAGDVSRYDFELAGCATPGRLIVGGYGQRALIREEVARFSDKNQLFFSGEPVANLDEGGLTRAYILDQLASKAGFREEGSWSRRLTVFDPPRGCEQPVSLSMQRGAPVALRRETRG